MGHSITLSTLTKIDEHYQIIVENYVSIGDHSNKKSCKRTPDMII